MNKLSLLFLILTACAPMLGGESGRYSSLNAICTVKFGGTAALLPVTQMTWQQTNHGFYYPDPMLVGWSSCFIPGGEKVRVLAGGEIWRTRKVAMLGEKGCVGSVPDDDLVLCSAGTSFTHELFPFLEPVPIVQSR